jgi:hypothetical protein
MRKLALAAGLAGLLSVVAVWAQGNDNNGGAPGQPSTRQLGQGQGQGQGQGGFGQPGGPGMGGPGMGGPGMGGPPPRPEQAQMVVAGDYLFVLRGDTLYQFEVATLKLKNKVTLDPIANQQQGFGPPGGFGGGMQGGGGFGAPGGAFQPQR